MMRFLSNLLNSMTMYRLMLWFLRLLVAVNIIFAVFNILPYDWLDVLLQAVFLVVVCWGANQLFAYLFGAKPNYESPIITALILTLIMGPFDILNSWLVLLTAGVLAMASKYLLAPRKSHIFNPAAFGVLTTAVLLGQGASWWVGGRATWPFLLIGGLIVLYRIERFSLVLSFLGAYLVLLGADLVLFQNLELGVAFGTLKTITLSVSTLFFMFVMLVEPLTSPATKTRRIYFGLFTGAVLFALQRFFPQVGYSLEGSLLLGNLFAWILSPGFRQTFVLKAREKLAENIISFWWEPDRPFAFAPGQFLEYTLPHKKADSRGLRRYFTIASSPTEGEILMTSKFADERGSTFKQKLKDLDEGGEIAASRVAGEFTLPADQKQKLAFIAGGIGVTPFRSMIKYLLDQNEKRDIVLVYAANSEKEFVFTDVFKQAEEKIGLQTIYKAGFVYKDFITAKIPDWQERIFYVSGPPPMVDAITKALSDVGLGRAQIKRDFFPGYSEVLEKLDK